MTFHLMENGQWVNNDMIECMYVSPSSGSNSFDVVAYIERDRGYMYYIIKSGFKTFQDAQDYLNNLFEDIY
jgi:hypothetical protein